METPPKRGTEVCRILAFTSAARPLYGQVDCTASDCTDLRLKIQRPRHCRADLLWRPVAIAKARLRCPMRHRCLSANGHEQLTENARILVIHSSALFERQCFLEPPGSSVVSCNLHAADISTQEDGDDNHRSVVVHFAPAGKSRLFSAASCGVRTCCPLSCTPPCTDSSNGNDPS